MHHRLREFFLVALVMIGCGGDDVMDEAARVSARATIAACVECRTTLGDEAECRTRYEWDSSTCVRGAYEADPTGVGPYIECRLAPANALADCVEAIVDDACTNALLAAQDCHREQQTPFEDCAGHFPEAADAVWEACRPSP